MSPPSVSLAKKEPLDLSFDDELPPKKVDDADAPSVITLDTDRRARNLRQQHKRKRCRIIACAVTLFIILAVAAALTFTLVKVLRKHRSSWKVADTAGKPMQVTIDDGNNLINAKHDHSDDEHVVVIEILHEYSRQLIAYKDVKNSTCYIDRLTETFEEGYARWTSYEKEGRSPKALKVISKPIEVEVLMHIGDIHIYAHCFSGNSYWVMEYDETDTTTVKRVVYA